MHTETKYRVAYSPSEAAKEGGPGQTNIYKAIKEGRLKAHKDGRRTIILHEDFVQYLRSLPLVQPAGEAA